MKRLLASWGFAQATECGEQSLAHLLRHIFSGESAHEAKGRAHLFQVGAAATAEREVALEMPPILGSQSIVEVAGNQFYQRLTGQFALSHAASIPYVATARDSRSP